MATGSRVDSKDRGFKRIVKMLKRDARMRLDVGWFPDAEHPSGLRTAEIAAVHEFGAPAVNIPARPMLRPIADKNQQRYARAYRGAFGRAIDKKGGLEGQLVRFGAVVEGDVKKHITTGSFAPLEAATIAAKGSSQPLIDFGTMRDQVEHRVIG